MILKGSQRGGGADLAIHLMNGFDNERIEIAEVHGTVAGDLYGAFAEFEAVSLGTKAKEYLYSLSINPREPLTREQYYEAIQDIEHRLGLTDQPRAVVFHVKDGREHCHVVWSRINVEKMRAVHMSHDHSRLMDLSCELARKFGIELTDGQKRWEAKQRIEKDYLDATLAENAQAKVTGITPDERRAEITAAYNAADSAEAFRAALEEKGYVLAKGDQRGYVVVDQFGDVHSLTRYVKDHKAGAIKKKLAALRPDALPSVDHAKELVRQRAQAKEDISREQEQRDESRAQTERQHKERAESLVRKQAARRLETRKAEQELLIRQQAEKLALHAAQAAESRGFLFRIRSAVADLIGRTPGLRSVLAPLQKLTHLDPKERHKLEDDALARRHEREKQDIERQKRFLKRVETRERASLEKSLRREQRLDEAARIDAGQEQTARRPLDDMAKQDFFDAAKDDGLWKSREFKEGELRQTFNDAAGFEEGAGESGDNDDGYAPDTDPDPDGTGDDDSRGPKQRRRRGRGYAYRRDSD